MPLLVPSSGLFLPCCCSPVASGRFGSGAFGFCPSFLSLCVVRCCGFAWLAGGRSRWWLPCWCCSFPFFLWAWLWFLGFAGFCPWSWSAGGVLWLPSGSRPPVWVWCLLVFVCLFLVAAGGWAFLLLAWCLFPFFSWLALKDTASHTGFVVVP